MSTPVPSSGTDSSRRSLFLSLRLWSALACILLAATVLLLPVPFGARAFILGVLLFSGVFLVVDAGGKGKTFAALTVALLGLYLLFTAQRGVMLIVSGNIAGTVLGVGLLLLPAVGAWRWYVKLFLVHASRSSPMSWLLPVNSLKTPCRAAPRGGWTSPQLHRSSRNLRLPLKTPLTTVPAGLISPACTMRAASANAPGPPCVTR